MRSKILAGTIIFGLLAVIALGIVAASPNSQAATPTPTVTPTPTATPTPSEKAYQLTVDAIKELARLNSTSDGLIFSAVTDVVIEIMAGTRNQTPQELKAQILSGLSNPTASDTLKQTLRVTDPNATLVTALLNNIVINIIADKTGETAAEARARLSTPATPTPTPTPTGSATATPSPTPTPTGSPTATPSPTPTPVPAKGYLDIWNWGNSLDGLETMVITWDANTLVRRAPKKTTDPGDTTTTLDPTGHASDATVHTTYGPAISDSTDRIKAFTNATAADTKLAEYVYRARLYFDTGQYAKAEADFTDAIALKPTSPLDVNKLRNLRGIARAFNKDYAKSDADFDSVLESRASVDIRGAAANNRGVVKALQAKYTAAFTDYQRAIDLFDSESPKAIPYNNMGSTHWARGDTDDPATADTDESGDLTQAITGFTTAIGKADDSSVEEARIQNNRGLAYVERGKTDSGRADCVGDENSSTDRDIDCAIADFGSASGTSDLPDPEEARFLNNKGLAYMERRGDADCNDTADGTQKDLDCAIADFGNAYTKAGDDPDHATFLNNRGLAYTERRSDDDCDSDTANVQKDLDCAIADFTEAIDSYGGNNDPDIYNNRGLAYRARNNDAGPSNNPKSDVDLAIADFTSAIGLRADAGFYYNRGLAYRAKNGTGDTGRAINDFTNAIKRNPANSDFYTERGNAYTANGQDTKAGQDLVFATKIKSSSVRCSDFQDFDTTYGTSFGSDRAAANAFYQAAMKAGYSQSGLNALMTGGAVCPSL